MDEVNGFRCVCETGFTGVNCEENVNDCSSNPCLNGGHCIDAIGDFECRCRAGFVGKLCHIEVDECDYMPCSNGGTCFDEVNDFRCECASGFTGKDCRININECESRPCKNGAACVDLVDDYSCKCPFGFTGKDCSQRSVTTRRNITTTTPSPPSTNITAKTRFIVLPRQETDITMTHLVLIVCLGAGIPLLVIIIFVIFLLLRRKNNNNNSGMSNDDMKTEKEQNIVNNMNNKVSDSSNIFTTISHSSSLKTKNEEQKDLNTFKPTKIYLEKASNKKFIQTKDLNTQDQLAHKYHKDSEKYKNYEREHSSSLSSSARPSSLNDIRYV